MAKIWWHRHFYLREVLVNKRSEECICAAQWERTLMQKHQTKLFLVLQWRGESEKSLLTQMFTSCCQKNINISPHELDTLSKPENCDSSHLVVFQTHRTFEEDTSFSIRHPCLPGVTGCTGVKVKGRKRQFCFSAQGPKLLMDALPKTLHPHTHELEQMVWLYANVLACGHALCALQSKRLKTTSDHLCFPEKKIFVRQHFALLF